MPKECAECHTKIGAGTPQDVYQHTVACLHVPDHGKEWALGYAKKHVNEEHGKRILSNLSGAE